MLSFQIFDLDNLGQGPRITTFAVKAIRWQISMSIKVTFCICVWALTISEVLTFQMFDLENLGQGHKEQHFQMAPFDGEY